MIYIKLFYNFLVVGLFSFGGAYSAIPLVMEVGKSFDVLNKDMLADFIAISESTPGSIGVNLATFVGATVAGVPGAIVATLAEVIPAFAIMLIITLFLKDFLKKDNMKEVLAIIRPCVIGMIMSVGIYMVFSSFKLGTLLYSRNLPTFDLEMQKMLIIFIVLTIICIIYRKIKQKSLGAIYLIIIGAILGITINLIM